MGEQKSGLQRVIPCGVEHSLATLSQSASGYSHTGREGSCPLGELPFLLQGLPSNRKLDDTPVAEATGTFLKIDLSHMCPYLG